MAVSVDYKMIRVSRAQKQQLIWLHEKVNKDRPTPFDEFVDLLLDMGVLAFNSSAYGRYIEGKQHV